MWRRNSVSPAIEFFLAIFSADAVIDIEPGHKDYKTHDGLSRAKFKERDTLNTPIEFFLAMSSADDVFLCSIRRFGMLNGGACMLSELY